MTPDLRAYVQSWLEKANHDVLSAERLLQHPPVLDTAAFHCQQAVEKYLKAFLFAQGRDIARTHNLVYLLQQCAQYDLEFDQVDPLHLNEFAVNGRYPNDDLEVTAEDVQSFLRLAQQTKAMVLERIVIG